MRRVVLICGPPGAGKSTLARTLGLPVYDRDDPQWRSERQFRAAIARLAGQPGVQAAVIRSGATRLARAQAARLIGATDVRILLVPADECRRRIAERGNRPRVDMRTQMAAAAQWWSRYQPDDGTPVRLPTGKRHPTGDPALKTPGWEAIKAYWRGQIRRQPWQACEADRCQLPGRAIRITGPRGPDSLDVGHRDARHANPDRSTWTVQETRPEHQRCNRAGGAAITNAKRRARAAPRRLALVLDDW